MSLIRLAGVSIGSAIGLVLAVMTGQYFPWPGRLLQVAAMLSVFWITEVVCWLAACAIEWAGRGDGGG